MKGSKSIIDLGDMSKPANTLIKKISDAIGGIFKPYQIRRIAQANADADKIKAVTQIEITELQHRAMQRFFIEEAKKQNNIESITSKALPLLTETSKPEKIEDDWITNFFDKCRLISDEEIQLIWSKILAGESNSPGNFSKRTVDLLASMDKQDAELFSNLCNFSFNIGGPTPLIYDFNSKIYVKNGINFSNLSHLNSIGLIQFDHFGGLLKKGLSQKVFLDYFDDGFWVILSDQENNDIKIGTVMLTQVGYQLAGVVDTKPIADFRNFVKEKWQGFGYDVLEKLTNG